MSKYLFTGSYTPAGLSGLVDEGGTTRSEAVGALLASLGGTVESVHFRADSDDFVIIADMPDPVSVMAGCLVVRNSGTVMPEATPLLTPEEMDHACKVTADFRPPGA